MTYFSSVADGDGYTNIPKNMTAFAKMLGLSRATLYRALDVLEKNGSILRENNKLKVIDNEKNY
jgi:DNA-binding MarR family transcriptional regulator